MKEWERQLLESEALFQQFLQYREQKPPRRIFPHQMRLVTDGIFDAYCWQERAQAYDDHIAAAMAEEREAIARQTVRDVFGKHARMTKEFTELCDREIAKWLTMAQGDMPITNKPADLVKLLETAIKYERLVHGESTENISERQDYSKLSLDELDKLQELLDKTKKDV